MKTEETSWPPVVHEWPEHAKLTEPDTDDMVKLVFGLTETEHRTRTTETARDDRARLDTTEARRLRDLERIGQNIREGLERLNLAQRDADNLSRMERVVKFLDLAIEDLHQAEGALDLESDR